MSEVSESLHLWRATHVATRELARSAGVLGRIITSNERWTTFVPLEDDEAISLACATPGLILHWLYFADYGLGLSFFENGAELGDVRFAWQEMPGEPVASAPDANLVETLRSKGVLDSFASLEELARGVTAGTHSPRDMRDRAAALLGIPAYEWLSPRYSRDTSLEEIQRLFPEAEELGDG